MGVFDKMKEKQRKDRLFKLDIEYKKLYIKCKTDKALEVLNEMFELKSTFAAETLLKTYERGYLYCDISHYDSLYKKMKRPGSYYRENNIVPKSMEKARYYLQRMLDQHGEKVKLPHTQLSKEDNISIGGLKVRIAYTYFFRWFTTERVQVGTEIKEAITVGGKVIVPETKRAICEEVFVLKEPEGNEYEKYMEWIRSAALLNQNYEALAYLAIAYWKDYERFGLECNPDKATALIIEAMKNYHVYDVRNLRMVNFRRNSLCEHHLTEILQALAKESQVADVYYQKVCAAQEKHRLEGKIAKMALEYARVSMLEEIADVEWHDKRTGKKIENIDAEIKKMETAIANLEKKLESMEE